MPTRAPFRRRPSFENLVHPSNMQEQLWYQIICLHVGFPPETNSKRILRNPAWTGYSYTCRHNIEFMSKGRRQSRRPHISAVGGLSVERERGGERKGRGKGLVEERHRGRGLRSGSRLDRGLGWLRLRGAPLREARGGRGRAAHLRDRLALGGHAEL